MSDSFRQTINPSTTRKPSLLTLQYVSTDLTFYSSTQTQIKIRRLISQIVNNNTHQKYTIAFQINNSGYPWTYPIPEEFLFSFLRWMLKVNYSPFSLLRKIQKKVEKSHFNFHSVIVAIISVLFFVHGEFKNERIWQPRAEQRKIPFWFL